MHDLVSIDGQIVDPVEARLDAVSRAALYGAGVFTTLAIYDREPFLWDKHWRRLDSNSTVIGIDLSSVTKTVVKRSLMSLIKANAVETGRARITLFDRSASDLWPYGSEQNVVVLITTGEVTNLTNDLRLTTSHHRINSTSPLKDVKSCNYLERLMVREDAVRRQFHDCIQLNERGEVASASMANVFWLKNGELFTPSLETGCLAGTTREFIKENLECSRVTVGLDELQSADAIFLTSAGYGVAQVSEFGGRVFASVDHPILRLLP
ncbi:MAG TPA: aminotransferase class IV [Pyrinomonadaceae bacterium]|nr:aminotransferase class IV [Pyrinomonadaceae bacterium]